MLLQHVFIHMVHHPSGCYGAVIHHFDLNYECFIFF